MTLLEEVVRASREVAETNARSAKVAILAELLRELEPAEVPVVAALLSGVPRQGRIGVGYAGVYGRDHAGGGDAAHLTVGNLDRTLTAIQETTGAGSAGARAQLIDGLLARATDAEGDFIRRLLTGELRQGALAGIMTQAVVVQTLEAARQICAAREP